MFIRIALFASVALQLIPAGAATWENISGAFAVDISSIQRKGSAFVVWQKMEFGGPTAYYEKGKFIRNDNLPKQQFTILTKYECDNRTFQYLHFLKYKDNLLILDDPTPDRIQRILPDSPYEKMLEKYCKEKWEFWK